MIDSIDYNSLLENFEGLEYVFTFVISFLASTLLPIGSEPFLILVAKFKNPLHLLLIATVGNTLGSMTNYFIGKFLSDKIKSETVEKILRKKAVIDKYGPATGLLCWLPIVGDIYATALGFFKLPLVSTTIFICLGKFFRYLIILLPFM